MSVTVDGRHVPRAYFAYGSNMLLARIRARVPSARALGPAALPGFRLTFHKIGADGSGKCDIEPASVDTMVHGVLFDVDAADEPALDRAEELGHGYDKHTLRVRAADGEHAAFTYVALRRDPGLRPFRWYHALVLAGAREHGLPEPYVAVLAAQPVREDPDDERRRRHEALLAVRDEEAG